jgi:hypothetical protein
MHGFGRPSEIGLAIVGTVVGAIVISTIIRLINGETWASANQFRKSEKVIFSTGYAASVIVAFTTGDDVALISTVFGFPALLVILLMQSGTPPDEQRPPDPP